MVARCCKKERHPTETNTKLTTPYIINYYYIYIYIYLYTDRTPGTPQITKSYYIEKQFLEASKDWIYKIA